MQDMRPFEPVLGIAGLKTLEAVRTVADALIYILDDPEHEGSDGSLPVRKGTSPFSVHWQATIHAPRLWAVSDHHQHALQVVTDKTAVAVGMSILKFLEAEVHLLDSVFTAHKGMHLSQGSCYTISCKQKLPLVILPPVPLVPFVIFAT